MQGDYKRSLTSPMFGHYFLWSSISYTTCYVPINQSTIASITRPWTMSHRALTYYDSHWSLIDWNRARKAGRFLIDLLVPPRAVIATLKVVGAGKWWLNYVITVKIYRITAVLRSRIVISVNVDNIEIFSCSHDWRISRITVNELIIDIYTIKKV